jgi:hypothetical protein
MLLLVPCSRVLHPAVRDNINTKTDRIQRCSSVEDKPILLRLATILLFVDNISSLHSYYVTKHSAAKAIL